MALLISAAPAAPAQNFLERGVAHWRSGTVDSAYFAFSSAMAVAPRDTLALAWFAEAARRMEGGLDSALIVARRVLAIAPCNSQAHTILGDVLNPQYSDYHLAHADSTWHHLREAVHCNPSEGNAWLGLWIQAQQRGDTAVENQAMRFLGGGEFIPAAPKSLARALLAALPPRAVVITNGDWDTYPAVGLQAATGLRADVAVVNYPLLNIASFARAMGRRHGLPLPFDSAGLEKFEPFLDDRGYAVYLADTVFATWRAAAAAGRLGRPLAIAATVANEVADRRPGALMWRGPYAEVVAWPGGSDLAAAARFIAAHDGSAFTGPNASEMDRSPVRHGSAPMGLNVLYIGSRLANERGQAGDRAGARAALEWIRTFAQRAGLQDPHSRYLVDWAEEALAALGRR